MVVLDVDHQFDGDQVALLLFGLISASSASFLAPLSLVSFRKFGRRVVKSTSFFLLFGQRTLYTYYTYTSPITYILETKGALTIYS